MTRPLPRVIVFTLLVTVAAAAGSPGQPDKAVQSLVTTQAGELPIIISAPHGGTLPVPGVPERKGAGLEKSGKGFATVRDTGTEEFARDIADAVKTKFGKKPYLVVARFARKYIDANRPPEVAYEAPKAKPTYDHYHGLLTKYCKEVQGTYGRGLLLDIHGQAKTADTVYRGTQNGKTVALLRQRFGEKAHTGPDSFFGIMGRTEGFKVFPPEGDGKEQAGFNGGHTVGTYGSHDQYGIDAMQLEFGADYRTKADKRKEYAKKLADVIDKYARLYLPDKSLKP
jgi:N-formylglutamate amidohydrolase